MSGRRIKDAKIIVFTAPQALRSARFHLSFRSVPGGKAPATALFRIIRYSTALENRMSMADRDGKIWMDGKLIDWRDAKIHVLTHTLHYGMGVFEGVRAYKTAQGTAIFRLYEHTQ